MSFGIDSKYSSGFPRWERARVNSVLEPTSGAANLYLERVKVAEEAAKTFPPFRHVTFYKTGYEKGKVDFRTCGPFCAALELQLANGVRHNQLAAHEIVDMIADAYADGYMMELHNYSGETVETVKKLGYELPSKPVKCRTCWKVINPNGDVTDRVDSTPVLEELWAKEQDFLAKQPEPLLGVVSPSAVTAQAWQAYVPTLYTIDDRGEITALENVAIVRLTSGQLNILQNYCTPDQRVTYGEDYTIHIDASQI